MPTSRKACLLAACLSLGACERACGPGAPILMYHSIGALDEPYAMSERAFTGHLDYLRAAGYHTVSLQMLRDHVERGAPLPPRAVVLTFDDGYADNYSRVLPLLKERGMKATFFVVTRFLGEDERHRLVQDQGEGKREKRFLIWPEVLALADAGMEIGSHSLFHKRLTELPLEKVYEDAKVSRTELSARLGRPIEFFAYPYNAQRQGVRDQIERAGYRGAVAGMRTLGDRFHMQRISVYRSMTVLELKTELEGSWVAGF